MADITVRASASNSAASGSALTVSAPAGTASGDLVIVILHGNGNAPDLSDNNGATPFTEDLTGSPNTTAGSTFSIFSRRIVGGDPSTYTFASALNDRWSAVAITFQNPDPSTIYDVTTGQANTDNPPAAAVATIPSVTVATTNSIHIAIGFIDAALTLTDTPAGYTLQQSTSNQAIRAATKTVGTGATGSLTMTGSASDAVMGLSIVIKNGTVSDTLMAQACL